MPEALPNQRSAGSYLARTAGLRRLVASIGPGNILCAAVFGVAAWALTSSEPGGSIAAAVVAQATVLPVLLAKVSPPWAAMTLAAGVMLNELLIGPLIRCGYIFPVMFVILFQLGAADAARYRVGRWVGLAACVVTTAIEVARDPALDASAVPFVGGLGLGFFCAGLLIRSRTTMVTALQRRTRELQEQRDRTAAMEVAADRARVGADLERLIRVQIHTIAENAERAKATAPGDTDGARAVLTEVEISGRETLAQMREVVGTLRDAPIEPPPGLDQLQELLARATCADTRLIVVGPVRPLTANLELSAYRIVEQLLTTLRDHPKARVDVEIRFTDEALEITVSGPAADDDATTGHPDMALHAVRVRADMHGGTVLTRNPVGLRETEVRLPLVSAAPR